MQLLLLINELCLSTKILLDYPHQTKGLGHVLILEKKRHMESKEKRKRER